jgi:hypothetical protein
MRIDWVRIMDNGHTELGGDAINGTPVLGAGHSGSFANAEQDGHGFSISFGYTPGGDPQRGVVYWYAFDDAGNPIFMLGSGVPDGNRLEVEFESPVGQRYGEFNPVPRPTPSGGTGVFVFEDENHASFSYTPSPFSEDRWGHEQPIENLPLTRLFRVSVSDRDSR